ncbi:MAG: permease [Candidatus Methanomethyliaceae archaeon]|nr:permease [Candidatus Methanomethyliaceae archaeon]MDW7970269.1 permease [Nitrososphaerota archaeon]
MNILEIVMGGIEALQDYVAFHVITCLIPAFLLAGAITTFLSRESILKYLGSETKKIISFPLAAISSMALAVCSCTVIPIASGLYRKGSSIGPAFIMLWTAPAMNILALVYTGAIIGIDMAIMRILAALSTSLIVGLIMVLVFKKEEIMRLRQSSNKKLSETKIISKNAFILIILLVVTLLLPNYLLANRPYIEKVALFSMLMLITIIYTWQSIDIDSIKAWLNETLWFVRMIFPLLLAGVFIVGMVGEILPRDWIATWFGGSGLLATFLATLIGAVSYFATLTEAPFVHTLMGLGMGKGPALGLLLAGPGLSLPNMLAIARIFGTKKAIVYIMTTIALATIMAFIIGNLFWI